MAGTNRDFQRIINRSMRYEFDGTVLTVTDWHTGQHVSIDLSMMTDEIFEELAFEDEEDEDE